METTVHTTIKPRTNIGAACATETTRYALCGALCKGNRLIATNGRIMAIAHADVERTAEAPAELIIDRKEFKGARELRVNGRVETIGGTVRNPKSAMHSLVDGTFPDYSSVFPPRDAKRVWFSLNVELLSQLAEAIGATDGNVSLGIEINPDDAEFDPGRVTRPIVALPIGDDRADMTSVGLIMPYKEIGSNEQYAAALDAK